MNRKQLRAEKAYERKHALEIAWRHASACGDLDDNGNYVRVSDPIAVNALYCAFHKHLLATLRAHREKTTCVSTPKPMMENFSRSTHIRPKFLIFQYDLTL